MLKRKIVLPTVSLVAVAAAVIAVSVAGSASAHKARHRARQASSATSTLLAAFPVLGKAATSGGTTLPSSARQAAGTEGSKAGQAETELTGEVEVTGQYPVWVSPRGGEICLIQENIVGPGVGSSFCATNEQALAGKLIGLSGKYPTHGAEAVIVGLAPSSNTSVQATDASGTSDTVSVHENVYEIVGKAPHTITLHDANGQTTTQEVPGT